MALTTRKAGRDNLRSKICRQGQSFVTSEEVDYNLAEFQPLYLKQRLPKSVANHAGSMANSAIIRKKRNTPPISLDGRYL